MKSFRIISLAAFSMLAFAACQQAEIAPEVSSESSSGFWHAEKTSRVIADKARNFELFIMFVF